MLTRKTSNFRYYSLDFWRGVACLMVVVLHSSFYGLANPNGAAFGGLGKLIFRGLFHLQVGVSMFFVISGYCITAACDGLRNRPQPMKLYFFRRFRRIFPPFWAAVLLLLLCVSAATWLRVPQLYFDDIRPINRPSSFSVWQWLGNVSLTEEWRPHLIGDGTWYFLRPSWSLCYEEQFYAVCGLLLILSRRWFFRGVGVITLLVGLMMLVKHFIRPMPVNGFFFDGRWLLFAAGILVYFLLHYSTPRFAKAGRLGLLAAGCLALAWRLHQKGYGMAEEYTAGFFFAFAISILYRWDAVIATSVLLRPITYCGIMCYSLYLIHWPVVKPITHLLYLSGVRGPWPTLAISIPLSLAVAIAVGWGFHLWIERRFLNTPPTLPWKIEIERTPFVPRTLECKETRGIGNNDGGLESQAGL